MDTDTIEAVEPVANAAPAATRRGFTLPQLALVLLWPLVILGLWILFLSPEAKVEGGLGQALGERPPVVIYNTAERLKAYSLAGVRGDDVFHKLDDEVAVLVDAGYVVIDGRTVLGAPDRYKVGDEK